MARVDGPISKLNDDCLREIFSYLTKRQLIGIERGKFQLFDMKDPTYEIQTMLIFILQFVKNGRKSLYVFGQPRHL